MIVNIAEQLSDEGFAFQPLIPDDDTELSQRVDALGQWCQGLLAGFALGMAQTGGADTGSPALSVEVSETLSDLSAISQAGFDEEEEHDQAEQDFFRCARIFAFGCTKSLYGAYPERPCASRRV